MCSEIYFSQKFRLFFKFDKTGDFSFAERAPVPGTGSLRRSDTHGNGIVAAAFLPLDLARGEKPLHTTCFSLQSQVFTPGLSLSIDEET